MDNLIKTLDTTEWENVLYHDEAELLMGLVNSYIQREPPGTRKEALVTVYNAISSLRDAIVLGAVNCERNDVKVAIACLKGVNHETKSRSDEHSI